MHIPPFISKGQSTMVFVLSSYFGIVVQNAPVIFASESSFVFQTQTKKGIILQD